MHSVVLSGYSVRHRLSVAAARLNGLDPTALLPSGVICSRLTILTEAGDLRRFAHHRQFLKCCGLDLAKCQSGQYKGEERLSKRGNARLRFAFRFAATVGVRMRENSFRAKCERYIQNDPTNANRKRRALIAITAK